MAISIRDISNVRFSSIPFGPFCPSNHRNFYIGDNFVAAYENALQV
jgi:hypothetical protein